MSYAQQKIRIKRVHSTFLLGIGLIFLVLMNYPDYNVGGSGLYMPFNNTTWIGFGVLLFTSVCGLIYLGRVKFSVFHLLYGVTIALLFLPLLYSDIRFISYEIMLIWAIIAAYILVFVSAQFSGKSLTNRVLAILLVSSVIQTIWGLIQFYFIFEPNILFLVADYNSPVGVFNQKNVFSIYLNLGSLIALYFYFNAKKKTALTFIAVLVLLIVNSHLNALADTRTSRVVSLIALAMYLGYWVYQTKKFKVPVVLLVVVLISSFAPKQWFNVRPVSIEAPIGIQSLGTRPVIYTIGAEMASQNLLSGVGIGQVRYQFAQRLSEKRHHFEGYNSVAQAKHIHNEPLQWIIQFGFVSGLAFLFLFACWVWGLKKQYLNPQVLLIALPLVGQSMLEFPFHSSAPHLLIFAIILGLSINVANKRMAIPSGVSILSLCFTAVISVLTISHMLQSLKSSKAMTNYQRAEVKSIDELSNVKPTLTFSLYIKMEIFEYKLHKGFATGQINVDDIYEFIEWAEDIKEYYPVNKIYVRLGQAYMISQNFEKAKQIIDEAEVMFPDDEQVVDMVKRMREFMNSQ